MTNRKIGRLVAGAFGMALLCGAGAASAQDLYADQYSPVSSSETVTVHPYNNLHSSGPSLSSGRSGSMYSEQLSMSRPVNFSDLDLTRVADARELRARISDTAHDLCAQLGTINPQMKDSDSDQRCVRDAIDNAMAQVSDGIG
jgi:UrcA family protein